MDRVRVEPRSEQAKCPFCHEVVAPADEKAPCLSCMAWHHRACRDEHGSCAACGATEGDEKKKRPPPPPAVQVNVAPSSAREEAPPPWLRADEPAWVHRQTPEPPPAWQTEEALRVRLDEAYMDPKPIGPIAILYFFLALIGIALVLSLVLAR